MANYVYTQCSAQGCDHIFSSARRAVQSALKRLWEYDVVVDLYSGGAALPPNEAEDYFVAAVLNHGFVILNPGDADGSVYDCDCVTVQRRVVHQ